jgi:hypothetical protein
VIHRSRSTGITRRTASETWGNSALAGLEEQRLLVDDEKLVEHEIDVGVVRGQAVDARGDLGELGLHDVASSR